MASSEVGTGSRFSLFLPMGERPVETLAEIAPSAELTVNGSNGSGAGSLEHVGDDSSVLDHDDRVVLVIASKPERAQVLVDRVHARGANAIVVRRPGASLGLAREHRPEAVLLAGEEPRAESVLGQLKNHPDTRHLPVVLIGDSSIRIDSLRAGAAAFLEEPLDEGALDLTLAELERIAELPVRRIALVADEGEVDEQITALLAGGGRGRARADRSTRRTRGHARSTVRPRRRGGRPRARRVHPVRAASRRGHRRGAP